MTGFSDLLVIIEESKKIKHKKISNPPPNNTNILHKFNNYREENLARIQNKIKLKYNVEPSRSSILNGDTKFKNNNIVLYITLNKIGEVEVVFDSSNFTIIDIHR
jgi:hypothetical protein